MLLLLLYHGCAYRQRQWNGPTGMSNWGGPGVNGQPGPECRSCFKDGISFAPGEAPQGFQMQEFSATSARESFFDATIAFTDDVIASTTDANRRAVVVLFRCALGIRSCD
jgi:hypothetical protein